MKKLIKIARLVFIVLFSLSSLQSMQQQLAQLEVSLQTLAPKVIEMQLDYIFDVFDLKFPSVQERLGESSDRSEAKNYNLIKFYGFRGQQPFKKVDDYDGRLAAAVDHINKNTNELNELKRWKQQLDEALGYWKPILASDYAFNQEWQKYNRKDRVEEKAKAYENTLGPILEDLISAVEAKKQDAASKEESARREREESARRANEESARRAKEEEIRQAKAGVFEAAKDDFINEMKAMRQKLIEYGFAQNPLYPVIGLRGDVYIIALQNTEKLSPEQERKLKVLVGLIKAAKKNLDKAHNALDYDQKGAYPLDFIEYEAFNDVMALANKALEAPSKAQEQEPQGAPKSIFGQTQTGSIFGSGAQAAAQEAEPLSGEDKSKILEEFNKLVDEFSRQFNQLGQAVVDAQYDISLHTNKSKILTNNKIQDLINSLKDKKEKIEQIVENIKINIPKIYSGSEKEYKLKIYNTDFDSYKMADGIIQQLEELLRKN